MLMLIGPKSGLNQISSVLNPYQTNVDGGFGFIFTLFYDRVYPTSFKIIYLFLPRYSKSNFPWKEDLRAIVRH